MWEVWAGLRGSVMTGEAAFPRVHGAAMWDYMAEHPHLGAAFNRWMSGQSDQHNAALVAGYDFSAFRLLADIGGGQGSTLAAILQANRSLRGILIDLPSVVSDRSRLQMAGVEDRCQIIGGDMFHDVPLHADAYLIKRVLMATRRPPRSCTTARLRWQRTERCSSSKCSSPRATIRAPSSPSTS
jgi:O-methyltransferase domain